MGALGHLFVRLMNDKRRLARQGQAPGSVSHPKLLLTWRQELHWRHSAAQESAWRWPAKSGGRSVGHLALPASGWKKPRFNGGTYRVELLVPAPLCSRAPGACVRIIAGPL
jgi:hypothetical protein